MSESGPSDNDHGWQPAQDGNATNAASPLSMTAADHDNWCKTNPSALSAAASDSSSHSASFALDGTVDNPEGIPADKVNIHVDSPDLLAVDSDEGKNTLSRTTTGVTTVNSSEGTPADSTAEDASDLVASSRESNTAFSTVGSTPVETAADSEKDAPTSISRTNSFSVTANKSESNSADDSTTHLSTVVTSDNGISSPSTSPAAITSATIIFSNLPSFTVERTAICGKDTSAAVPPLVTVASSDNQSVTVTPTQLTAAYRTEASSGCLPNLPPSFPSAVASEGPDETNSDGKDKERSLTGAEYIPDTTGGGTTSPGKSSFQKSPTSDTDRRHVGLLGDSQTGTSESVVATTQVTPGIGESVKNVFQHSDDRKNSHTISTIDNSADQFDKLTAQNIDTGRPTTSSSRDGYSSDSVDISNGQEMGCGKISIKKEEDLSDPERDHSTPCLTTLATDKKQGTETNTYISQKPCLEECLENDYTGPDMPPKRGQKAAPFSLTASKVKDKKGRAQKSQVHEEHTPTHADSQLFTVTFSNVPVLSAFGFKEHCEATFKHCQMSMSLDCKNNSITFKSSSDCKAKVQAEAVAFLEQLYTATMNLEQVSFKLLRNHVALDHLNKKLEQTGSHCSLQLDTKNLKAFAKSQDDAYGALKVISGSLLLRIVEIQGCNKDEVQTSLKKFCRELKPIEGFYLAELDIMDRVYQLFVVFFADREQYVFKQINVHFPYKLHHVRKSAVLPLSQGPAACLADSANIGSPQCVASETHRSQTTQCVDDPHPQDMNRGQEATETMPVFQTPVHGTDRDAPSVSQMGSGLLCNASSNLVGQNSQSTAVKDPKTKQLLPKTTGQAGSQMGGIAVSSSCDSSTNQGEASGRLPLQHNSAVHSTEWHTDAQREIKPRSNTTLSQNARHGDDANSSHRSRTPTSRPLRLVTIPALIAQMLTHEDVRKDFAYALTKVHVIVEFDALSQKCLCLVCGELDALNSVLKSFFCDAVITCDKTDDMVHAIVLSLKETFQHQLIYHFDDAQCQYRIAFLRSKESEINPTLQDLNTFEEHIPLPLYKVKYCISYLQVIKKACEGDVPDMPFQLELSISSSEPGRLGLLVRTERQNSQKVMKAVYQQLTKIVMRETDIGIARGLFLQDDQKNQLVQNIQTEKQCLLSVRTPMQSVFIHAKSPKGGELMVCSGNIAESDCQVLVIPLCEGKTQWPDLYKQILKKGFLPEEVARYLEEVGSPEQKMDAYTMTLNCNKDLAGKKVVVMFVPWSGYNKFSNYLQDACKEALEAAFSSDFSAALPLDLGDTLSTRKVWKRVLSSVINVLESSPAPKQVKLLLNMQTPCAMDLCRNIEDYLVNCRWIVSCYFQQDSRVPTRIKVVVGDVLDTVADVYVNSTDGDLTHENGLVSKIVLNKAGEGLKTQCRELYPKGIRDNVVARTCSFKLTNVRWIFHIELHGKWKLENAEELLQELKIRVQACLALASSLRCYTIAFPTLGLGTLGYPPDRVANTMFSATREFFTEMPHSSLKCVLIMCYHQNVKALQVFSVEEVCDRMRWTVGGIIDVKDAQVLVVQKKNRDALHFGANFTICGPHIDGNFEDYKKRAEDEGSRAVQWTNKKAKGMVKYACQACSDDPRNVRLQIDMQTFGQDWYQDIVSSLSSELFHFLVVYLVVVSDADVHVVAGKLKKAIGTSKHTWNWFGSESNSNNSASGGTSTGTCLQETDKGCIRIIGHWWSTSSIPADVLSEPVPENYTMKADAHEKKMRDGSSVDIKACGRSDEDIKDDIKDAVREDTKETSSSDEPDTCRFTIPFQRMKNMNIEHFYQCLESETKGMLQGYSEVGQDLVFRTSLEDFVHVVNIVWSIIRNHAGAKSGNNQTAAMKPQSSTIVLDRLEYEALEYLEKTFCKSVTTVKENNGKVTLSAKGEKPSCFEKLGSLRREDVQLPADDLARLGQGPLDTSEENLEAFIKPLQDQGKVAILAFDYNTITKAKHLVSVRAGKVKVTARARRRFDGTGQGEHSPPQSIDSFSSQPMAARSMEFTNKSGIKVLVYKTDITKLPVEAIVNAANGHLNHGGGVAYAIARAAGIALEEEGEAYVMSKGPLKVTDVVSTTAGALPCKKVLHAVGPRWDDYQNKVQCQQDLEQTVFNCLVIAHNLRFSSLAVSSISSAIFGVPKELCAQMYLSAVKSFDKQYGGRTSLQVIHFVDVSDHMVSTIQDVFTKGWGMDGMASGGIGTPYIPQGAAPPPRNSSAVSANSISQTGYCSSGQREVVLSHSNPSCQDTWYPDTDRQQSNPGDPAATVAKKAGSWQYQDHRFSFVSLDMIFQQQRAFSSQADAVVLWQYSDCVLQSEDTKQLIKGLNVSDVSTLKMKLIDGAVEVVATTTKLLILPVVSSSSPSGKVCDLFERAMGRADQLDKKSVAVTCFSSQPGSEDNKHVVEYSEGIYLAVKKYIERTQRSITQVYILEAHLDTLKVIEATVGKMLALDRSKEDLVNNEKQQAAVQASVGARSVQDSNNEPLCVICQDKFTYPIKTMKCGHIFCSKCIDQWIEEKPVCPTCQAVHGILIGNQPTTGTMKMRYLALNLSDYEHSGAYAIDYSFPPGKQTDEHPNPGRWYSSVPRTAYLPDTPDGRKVLMLLKVAFDRRLVFTVGRSTTTGRDDCVIWNDIHHKTNTSGGSTRYGYPDPTYLTRVEKELAAKGVTCSDLTEKQKDFISNPKKYSSYHDFCHKFHETNV